MPDETEGRSDEDAFSLCPLCGQENPQGATICTACGNDDLGLPRAIVTTAHGTEVRVFRALVVITTAAFLGYIALGWLIWYRHESLISPETWNVLQWSGYGGSISLPLPVWYLKRFLYVAAAVGLYRFAWPARLVYTALVAFDTMLLPFTGLGVETPAGEFLISVSLLADGAILAMAWLSPLKNRFVRL